MFRWRCQSTCCKIADCKLQTLWESFLLSKRPFVFVFWEHSHTTNFQLSLIAKLFSKKIQNSKKFRTSRLRATQGAVVATYHNFEPSIIFWFFTMEGRVRTESFESIPDVDFMIQSIETDLASFDISDFRMKEAAGELLPEPLLVPDNSRFVLFPIKHSDVS